MDLSSFDWRQKNVMKRQVFRFHDFEAIFRTLMSQSESIFLNMINSGPNYALCRKTLHQIPGNRRL